MHITHTLTGNKRHRAEPRRFREPLMVLQVEVHAKGYEYPSESYGARQDVNYRFWRDAQIQDITEEK